MFRSLFRLAPLVTASVVLGCGGDGDGGIDEPISLDGPCDPAERLGGFRIESFPGITPAFSAISGGVKDAVNPIEVREVIASDGDCRLLRRNNPFCEPACAGGQLCTFEGTCVAFPAGVSLGTVSVHGLRGDRHDLEPLVPGNTYSATDVPHPLFESGDEIRLRSVGDLALALDGIGASALVPAASDWVVTDGEPTDIQWTASAEPSDATIGVTLSIDQHGTTPVALVCEFADTGQAAVSAAMTTALFAAGVSGFPNASIERRTRDSQSIAGGCADLVVAHPVNQPASVSGHTPCNNPNQCPTGQVCDLESETCIDE